MEKVTIQLEEVTVKLIDKMIEFKNENYEYCITNSQSSF